MDGWDERAPPRKVFGNTWYVGTCGITALLVTSAKGHVLIDGATEAAGPLIEANIRVLGFDPRDVKTILNSHQHFDHAGGIAYLQRATGAEVRVSATTAATLRRGRSDRGDPQFLGLPGIPPVANVQILANGETVHVGGLALTAHPTPGHTPGGTSWSWISCEGARCLHIVYVDSVSAIGDGAFRYGDRPEYVAAFRQGLDAIAALPCDVLLTPHPGASGMWPRLHGAAPLVDAGACKAYAENGRAGLAARLEKERTGQAP
jgi:metallo-beta-lactamase class B